MGRQEQLDTLKSLGQGAAAYLLGISTRRIADLLGLPRNADGTYDAQAVHAWDVERKLKLAAPPSDDPLLSGGDSPALERYRLAKAQREELELEVRRGNLVPREDIRQALSRMAQHIRRASEWMARHAPEANAMLDEALSDYQREMEAGLGS